MKNFDRYVRNIYFVNGNIGLIKLSLINIFKAVLNLPFLIFWAIWKGLFSR